MALMAAAERWAGSTGGGQDDLLALHLADSVAAGLAGLARGTAGPPIYSQGDVAGRIGAVVAATRSTEVDDIHMAACVTPGAIVVPVALGLIAAGLADPARLGQALGVGYDAMIGLGLAIGGPAALYAGVWPTMAVAPLGAAITAGSALGLDATGLAHAMAMSVPFASGRCGHARGGHTSRWLLIGEAARAGVVAALAAKAGYAGDLNLLQPDRLAAALGVPVSYAAEFGPRRNEIGFKPICAAKQTMAAVAAFRGMLAKGLDPATIEAIQVQVPPAYRAMIAARHQGASDRLGSITNIAYQLSLVAYHPERLLDIARLPLVDDAAAIALAAKVRVLEDQELATAYPQKWPARLRVRIAHSWDERTIEVAPGDAGTGFDQQALANKIAQLFAVNGVSHQVDHLIAASDAALTDPDPALEVASLLFSKAEHQRI